MGEGTRCVTVADSELLDAALARIDILEMKVSVLEARLDDFNCCIFEMQYSSATQVAEAA
jgi:hypothetical protein